MSEPPGDEIDPNLQRLIDAHPLLFRGRAPAVPSYVCAGWFGLIDKLCSDIEAALGPDGCAQFEVRQIKEKFAALRFYYRFGEGEDLHLDVVSSAGHQPSFSRQGEASQANEEQVVARLRALVAEACATSETICDQCGAAAVVRNISGYYVTLCDQHASLA